MVFWLISGVSGECAGIAPELSTMRAMIDCLDQRHRHRLVLAASAFVFYCAVRALYVVAPGRQNNAFPRLGPVRWQLGNEELLYG